MPDRVDPAMDAMKATGLLPPLHRAPRDAKREELADGDDAVLPGRKPRHLRVQMVNPIFATHTVP